MYLGCDRGNNNDDSGADRGLQWGLELVGARSALRVEGMCAQLD